MGVTLDENIGHIRQIPCRAPKFALQDGILYPWARFAWKMKATGDLSAGYVQIIARGPATGWFVRPDNYWWSVESCSLWVTASLATEKVIHQIETGEVISTGLGVYGGVLNVNVGQYVYNLSNRLVSVYDPMVGLSSKLQCPIFRPEKGGGFNTRAIINTNEDGADYVYEGWGYIWDDSLVHGGVVLMRPR